MATMFVDASVIVAILNGEPGHEEFEKRFEEGGKFYISPLVRFEAVTGIVRSRRKENTPRSADGPLIGEAQALVDLFLQRISAKEIAIDGKVGRLALEAMMTYGAMVGHKADLNFGDCFFYGAAKSLRLPLLYKGNDFSRTDLA